MYVTLSQWVGNICMVYRRDVLGMTQADVADALGYSQENISAFENGRNSNLTILLWYVHMGLFDVYTADDLCGIYYD